MRKNELSLAEMTETMRLTGDITDARSFKAASGGGEGTMK